MKRLNKRYVDHDICSIVGTKTIGACINDYVFEASERLKEIYAECEKKEDFSPENLYLPIILICDASTDVVQHKLDLLKSSIDRYLFADEDFKQSSIKHDKLTKTIRLQPTKKFRVYNVKSEHFPQKFNLQPTNSMEVDVGDGLSY
jgi:hypothetical protein